ncbi:protein ENL-like [Capsicum galapagoense]
MGDNTAPNTSKKQKKESEVAPNHAKHSKFYNHFLFKASLIVIFLVVLPLFTSEAPDFINQTLQTRSWEVLQLIFVGIAVSYGLFSRKSDETDKEHNTKFDNAQSYVSGLLHVSSVFDDEADIHDENKVQTWNNQYHRGNNPVVVVAKENHSLNEHRAINSRIGEKPLLLPIRSLKSRVLDDKMEGHDDEFSSKSRKEGSVVSSPKKLVDNMEENVVRPSPIPWRSRSAKNVEMKDENNHCYNSKSSSKEDTNEFKKIEPFSLRSQSFRSHKTNNYSNSSSPRTLSPSQSRKLSPSLSFSSESQSKIVNEDILRKKIFRKAAPPPPPPPPPPHFFYKNSPLLKSSSSVTSNGAVSSEKELRRSIRSVPMESTRGEKFQTPRKAYSGTELRPFVGSTRAREYGAEFASPEDEETFVKDKGTTDKMMHESYNFATKSRFMEFPNEDKKEYVEKFLVETDQEDSETESEDYDYFEENANKTEVGTDQTDEGPDVDKKADEFIAKFREQIRLQRIESIRRSAGQPTRNLVR